MESYHNKVCMTFFFFILSFNVSFGNKENNIVKKCWQQFFEMKKRDTFESVYFALKKVNSSFIIHSK